MAWLRVVSAAGIFVIPCAILLSQQQTGRTVTVQGTVADLKSGQSLSDARILLTGETGLYRGMSDAGGKFAVEGLPPGDYKAVVQKDGYFWTRRESGPADLTLIAGQDLRNVLFRLTKGSAISGHVLDENGDPEADVSVMVLRLDYRNGRRTLTMVPRADASRPLSLTNADGEYRLYGLEPGEYYIKAHHSGKPLAYFPSAVEPDLAVPIRVFPGSELVGMDLKVSSASKYTVSFAVAGNAQGAAASEFVISLIITPRDSAKVVDASTGLAADFTNGRYRSVPLLPGDYELQWSQPFTRLSGHTTFSIRDRDIDLGTLSATAGIALSGRIRMADPRSELKAMMLLLLPLDGAPAIADGTSTDGTFVLTNVYEGDYWVNLQPLSQDLYVQSARYGARVPNNGDISVGKEVEGPLEIVLATGASVGGTVRNARSEIVPYTPVLVYPARGRQHPGLFKTVETDKNGSFTVYGLAPGEYRALAWEDALPPLYRDPAFLDRLVQRATAITVQNGTTTAIDVRVIPREN